MKIWNITGEVQAVGGMKDVEGYYILTRTPSHEGERKLQVHVPSGDMGAAQHIAFATFVQNALNSLEGKL